MSTLNATYTQLRDGSWGLRIVGQAKASDLVMVKKRSGEQKEEKVDKVLWSGRDKQTGQTITLATISQSSHVHTHTHTGNVTGNWGSGRRTKYGCKDGQCYCPYCTSGSECLCKCACGFGG